MKSCGVMSPFACQEFHCAFGRGYRSREGKVEVPHRPWLVQPRRTPSTAIARRALPKMGALPVALHQLAQVGAMVAACFTNDVALFGRAIDDQIAEPARAALLPGFTEAKQAALAAGALGCSISGAGPT